MCNDSFDVLNLAVAYDDLGDGFFSEGYWMMAPNHCVPLIREWIRSRYVYVFATNVFNQALLGGWRNSVSTIRADGDMRRSW